MPCPIVGGSIGFRVVARTEMGGTPPGDASPSATNAQVFSGQRLQADLECRGLRRRTLSLFQLVTVDQVFATVPPFKSYEAVAGGASGVLATVLAPLLGGTAAMTAVAHTTAPSPAERPFWLSPYVSFSPRGRSSPGSISGDLGNFAQPDVIVGLAKTRSADAKVVRRRFISSLGGSVDLGRQDDAGPSLPGLPLLHRGLNAFAAAQAYYHRPGDWREMPNFFNPLWGARLMPIAESNAASMIPGLARLPLLLH
jgi:hypothetical protein